MEVTTFESGGRRLFDVTNPHVVVGLSVDVLTGEEVNVRYKQHAQMVHDDKLHEVMAIGFLYYGQ